MAGEAFEKTLSKFRRWAATTDRKLSGDTDRVVGELGTVFT